MEESCTTLFLIAHITNQVSNETAIKGDDLLSHLETGADGNDGSDSGNVFFTSFFVCGARGARVSSSCSCIIIIISFRMY